jgi:flagellar basal body rod protein FlgB
VYNSQLERQIASQKQMMAELRESIENATIIERGISPLMMSMLKGLEEFVALDIPFKKEQRENAIADLYVNMDSAKFSAAEKFRQILEVYDIESEYSSSLESYRDLVDIDANGSEVEVEMLRIGRVALMYQTKDKSQTGAWNKETGSWETLGSEYRRPVDQGIRIAKKLSPQDVMQMPITAPETAQ